MTSPRHMLAYLSLGLCTLLLVQCQSTGNSPVKDDPARASSADDGSASELRNIILVIGDGMGPNQVGLLTQYARHAPNSPYDGRPTSLEKLTQQGVTGLAETYAQGALTVDSACSATHLSAGTMAPLEALGVDLEGNPVPTVLQRARDSGRATGLVTDTRATHATPAAFFSHTAHRSLEDDIAHDLFDEDVDLMLAGGLRHFVPSFDDRDTRPDHIPEWAFPPSSFRDDGQDLLLKAHQQGYQLAFDHHELNDASALPLLGLFAESGMFHAIEERQTVDDPQRRQPTLDEMTLAALDLLDERPEGFFLMVEAGQIDWAGHANDAGWLLHEMLRLDVTLDTIFNWMNDRDDTLVIVTADHETGGFGFSYSSNDLPDATPLSGPVFDHRDHQPNFNFGALHQLDELASQQKTFGDLLDHLDEGDPDAPAKLQTLVDKHTSYTISSSQAERVLQKHKNPSTHRITLTSPSGKSPRLTTFLPSIPTPSPHAATCWVELWRTNKTLSGPPAPTPIPLCPSSQPDLPRTSPPSKVGCTWSMSDGP